MLTKYRIFFVDDEPWVLNGLRELFRWEDEGFEIAGQYNNSLAALEDILRVSPDVVIVDITMPRIDGLELMQCCNERGYHGVFVILTGYDEFEYARRAIEQKAFGYLLKPIDREEVRDVLRRIRRLLDEEQLRAIDMEPEKDWTALLSRLIGVDHGSYYALAVHGRFRPAVPDDEHLLLIRESQNRAFYLLSSHLQAGALCKRWRPGLTETRSFLGISEPFARLSAFSTMMRHAEIALYDAFVNGEPRFYPYRRGDRELVGQALALLDCDLKDIDAGKLRDAFLEKASMNDVVLLLNALGARNAPVPDESESVAFFEAEDVIMLFSSIEEVLAFALDSPASGAEEFAETQNSLVYDICCWIQAHYATPIRLSVLSGIFHVSETSICELFRKHRRQTLTQYVLSVRMKKAAELLLATQSTLGDIAEAVGYNDYAYFGRIFKRFYDVSPSLYRKVNASSRR